MSRLAHKARAAPSALDLAQDTETLYPDIANLATMGKEAFSRILEPLLAYEEPARKAETEILWDAAMGVASEPLTPLTKDQTGGVYSVHKSSPVKGAKPARNRSRMVAVFKPAEEEGFSRAGLLQGEGAIREEAAFLLDSLYGGFSGVPSTALASMPSPKNSPTPSPGSEPVGWGEDVAEHPSHLRGSVQAWVDAAGSMDDYGMPHDLKKAAEFVGVQEVQKIATIDLRLFNTDRHCGNILLSKEEAKDDACSHTTIHACSFRLESPAKGSSSGGRGSEGSSSGVKNGGRALIPIDHGCILPRYLSVGYLPVVVFASCSLTLHAARHAPS
jgi:hypothetical protein